MSRNNNKYYTLKTYDGLYIDHIKNNIKVEPCTPKLPPQKENFGSFSIAAAVRYPWRDLSYPQQKLDGVN